MNYDSSSTCHDEDSFPRYSIFVATRGRLLFRRSTPYIEIGIAVLEDAWKFNHQLSAIRHQKEQHDIMVSRTKAKSQTSSVMDPELLWTCNGRLGHGRIQRCWRSLFCSKQSHGDPEVIDGGWFDSNMLKDFRWDKSGCCQAIYNFPNPFRERQLASWLWILIFLERLEAPPTSKSMNRAEKDSCNLGRRHAELPRPSVLPLSLFLRMAPGAHAEVASGFIGRILSPKLVQGSKS